MDAPASLERQALDSFRQFAQARGWQHESTHVVADARLAVLMLIHPPRRVDVGPVSTIHELAIQFPPERVQRERAQRLLRARCKRERAALWNAWRDYAVRTPFAKHVDVTHRLSDVDQINHLAVFEFARKV